MIKKILLIMMFGTAVFASVQDNNEKQIKQNRIGIIDYKTVDDALSQAKKEHKNVLVFAHKEDCAFCRKVEEVLTNPETRGIVNQKYVFVKIKKGDPFLVDEFKPLGYPTFFIISENKKLIDYTVGYQEKDVFNIFLNDK